MKKTLNYILKVVLPLLLAAGILWWMYRGVEWAEIARASHEMSWTWMLLSMPFGVTAQLFRAMRWRQALAPMGEKPRLHTCVNAIFLSYASSLVVPRIGEVLRCGVLTRYEGTNFGRSVGTVVSERVVDMLLILLLTLVTVVCQVPVFVRFMGETGMSVSGVMGRFSLAGYGVTALCGLLVLAGVCIACYRLNVFSRTRAALHNLKEGLLSIRQVDNVPMFLLNSVGIWASYFLHFYLTFYCFSYTQDLGPMCALVAFVVGSFAVLVPTPNGAGSWHFAVKVVLMLYGVAEASGLEFALIVHTLQTFLVLLLGLYALGALALTKPIKDTLNSQPSNN